MSLITCKNVSFEYDGKNVLEDVSFEVCAGDFLCVAGANGSGKSTLINGLLKLKAPSKGKIIFSKDLNGSGLGYLPQNFAAQKDFPASVFEVVLSGLVNSSKFKFFYSKKDLLKAEKALKNFAISDLRQKPFRELSGGQQRRALLARALCAEQKVLVLDEPANGLDPQAIAGLYSLLKKLNKEKGVAVIIVSHDVKNAASYCGKILHLENRQIFFGAAADYLNSRLGKKFINRGDENV
jgi:zinc transport system ATP-binding protein